MRPNILTRFLISITLALVFSLVTAVIGYAQDGDPISQHEPDDERECVDCHEEIQQQWDVSSHGQATDDAEFVEAWAAQNNPGECLSCHTTGFDAATETYEHAGITCDNCHTLVANGPNHPEQVMVTDYSAASCGNCHVDTYDQWQVSEHGEADMTCNNCHNPHSTSIRGENVQTLCQSCHTTEGHFYTYTAHAAEGLICTDCHLRISDNEVMGEGHGKREHTFAVDLRTCNECHGDSMHNPEDMTTFAVAGTPPDSTPGEATTHELSVQSEPKPASYLNFALLAGLIGLAFGAVGSPWVERGLRLILLGVK